MQWVLGQEQYRVGETLSAPPKRLEKALGGFSMATVSKAVQVGELKSQCLPAALHTSQTLLPSQGNSWM